MKDKVLSAAILFALVAGVGWTLWAGLIRPSELAANGGSLVLMDFHADWCGPCVKMKPVVHELAEELRGQLTVREIDVDENPDLARQYGVRSIPCFVVIRDGREINRRTGSMPKETLRELVDL